VNNAEHPPSSARVTEGDHDVAPLRSRWTTVSRFAALAAASLLGGGVALGAAALFGAFEDGTTTVVDASRAAVSVPLHPTTGLSVGDIYRRAGGGVVQITTTTGSGGGLGSGFVIDKDGHIVTNYHVIDGADTIEVSFSNRETLSATLVGSDPSSDLAVLQVDASAATLTPLTLADSSKVQVGDPVVAIGNPFGLESTVTAGIVSALQRAVKAPNGYAIDQVIQTDAPINQGNSGGPLIDAQGQVIGVNSQIETGGSSSGNVGIGFAVPANTVKTVVRQLIEKGSVQHAYIGVTLQDLDSSLVDALGLQADLKTDTGLLVQAVQPGSPAEKAGLKGGNDQSVVNGVSVTKGGDVLTELDGTRLTSTSALRAQLDKHAPGDRVTFRVLRNGAARTVTVTLGSQPSSAS
jgi:S1-C subfamily serine protease